jgi:hypothetical protein
MAGKLIAVIYGYRVHDGIYSHLSGFDPAFARKSVGSSTSISSRGKNPINTPGERVIRRAGRGSSAKQHDAVHIGFEASVLIESGGNSSETARSGSCTCTI